jgi:hypothetical protein
MRLRSLLLGLTLLPVTVVLVPTASTAASIASVSDVTELLVVPSRGGASRTVFRSGSWRILGLSPDRTRMVATTGSSLFVAGIRSGSAKKVAELGSISTATWSPSGREIAFSSYGTSSAPEPCGVAVWIVARDGSDLRRLSGCANFPAWSPNSKQLAFIAYTAEPKASYIVIESRTGVARRQVAKVTPPARVSPSIAWAPVAGWLAYTTGHPDRVRTVRVYGQGRFDLGRGDALGWTRDGRLLVVRFGRGGGLPSLFAMKPDGSKRHRIARRALPPASWSRDGRSVAFVRPVSGKRTAGIYVATSSGDKTRQVTQNGTSRHNSQVQWSPDGRQIFYVRESFQQ